MPASDEGGFLNLLQSLLPGGGAPAAAKGEGGTAVAPSPPAAQQGGGFMNFLSTLFQPTVDAFQQDVDVLRGPEWRMPPNAAKVAEQALGAMGSPSINPVAPAMRYTRFMPGPEGPGQFIMEQGSKVYPGGDWLTLMMRQGNLGPLLEVLLKSVEKVPR